MIRRWSLFVLLLLPVWGSLAQGGEQVEVIYPQPVSLLRGSVEMIGTVNLPDENGYYVQFRRLTDDLAPINGENTLWSPATMPQQGSVTEGVVGVWNTELVDDGVYQLEFVVQRTGGEPVRVRISPVRVENDLPQYDGARYSAYGTMDAAPTAAQPGANTLATLPPTPQTPLANASPSPAATAVNRNVTVTATIQANVRLGDSTTYPAIDFLDVGDTVPAIGVSNRSTWIQVRMPDGDIGFISPSTVRVNGDLNFLPRVTPPPLPYTATPLATATPPATPTPITSANLVVSSFALVPSNPQCNETFRIVAVIQNVGSTATTSSGSISVTDRHIASGTEVESTSGGFPVLAPGQSFEAIIPLTVTAFFDEAHRLTLTVDSLNQVPETTRNDNTFTLDYTLAKAACG